MSELRLNIRDRSSAIYGNLPGGTADAAIGRMASGESEPEKIDWDESDSEGLDQDDPDLEVF